MCCTWHNKSRVRFRLQPGFAVALLARLVNELELDGHLPVVGDGKRLGARLDKLHFAKVHLGCINHDLI